MATTLLTILMLSPLIILGSHLIFSRFNQKSPPQIIAIFSILLSYLPVGALCGYALWRNSTIKSTDLISGAIYFFVVFSALAYAYFHLFNMGETARRIRLLAEIRKVGSLTAQELSTIYKESEIVELRLQRLVDMKQLTLDNGYYTIKRKILYYVAKIILAWRYLLGFDPL